VRVRRRGGIGLNGIRRGGERIGNGRRRRGFQNGKIPHGFGSVLLTIVATIPVVSAVVGFGGGVLLPRAESRHTLFQTFFDCDDSAQSLS
jgi:hypothetical protein